MRIRRVDILTEIKQFSLILLLIFTLEVLTLAVLSSSSLATKNIFSLLLSVSWKVAAIFAIRFLYLHLKKRQHFH